MISQHSQTATLTVGVSQEESTEGMVVEAIPSVSFANAKLQNFIALRPDAREVRKALAIKLVYQGYLYDEIQTILDGSRGSLSGLLDTLPLILTLYRCTELIQKSHRIPIL